MGKKKWGKLILLFAAIILPLIGLQHLAFCHGGGGGGGGGEERNQFENLPTYSGAATTFVSELTYEEIKDLMSGLNAETRSMLLDDYLTWPQNTTVKALIALIDTGVPVSNLNEDEKDFLLGNLDTKIKDFLLKDWSAWTENMDVADIKKTIKNWQALPAGWAKNQDMMTTVVEYLDEGGQKAQAILAFCPVALPYAVAIDVVRGGAEANKNGKNSGEILKDTIIAGATSFAINKWSKADDILDKAKESKHIKTAIIKYLGYKETENQVGSAAQKITHIEAQDIEKVEIITTFVKELTFGMPIRKNRVKGPKYRSNTGYAPGQSHQAQHMVQ